jgi:dUTP pyrophosphatase
MTLKFFKLDDNAPNPVFKTDGSCCFDMAFNCEGVQNINGFSPQNGAILRPVNTTEKTVAIGPKERLLIPTGIIFVIPEGFSVRFHARSGTALKQGLVMANQEGVIDSDYFEEAFLLMTNLSDNVIKLVHGTRYAQGELVRSIDTRLEETFDKPGQTTDRSGGFGSTG